MNFSKNVFRDIKQLFKVQQYKINNLLQKENRNTGYSP